MKSIVYVSKVTATNGGLVPTGLAQILKAARANNAKMNISGVLSFRHGFYIQILEGDDDELDRLFERIEKDPRHEKVIVLIDCRITKRSFTGWNMKLLQSVEKESRFLKFVERYSYEISNFDSEQKSLFKHFFMSGCYSSALSNSFDGKDVQLLAWPNFSKVKQTPRLFDLCAHLIKQPHSFDVLIESHAFGGHQELYQVLKEFNDLGILEVSDTLNSLTQQASVGQSSNFYLKMKSFLMSRT